MRININVRNIIAAILVIAAIISMAAAMITAFSGCRSLPWQNNVVMSYSIAGDTLAAAKPTLMSLCDSGNISQEDCLSVRSAYNEAVSVYKSLGDAAIVALDSGDTGKYRDLQQQLFALLGIINKFIVDNANGMPVELKHTGGVK